MIDRQNFDENYALALLGIICIKNVVINLFIMKTILSVNFPYNVVHCNLVFLNTFFLAKYKSY